MNKEEIIWKNYREFKELGRVVRAGFGLCGVYDYDKNTSVWKKGMPMRPESDLEHVAGMTKLARLISWYYPSIIPRKSLDDFIYCTEIHEMGERESGDIPDDGSRNESKKDELETIAIKECLKDAPPYERGRGIMLFNHLRDKDTPEGRTIYCLDKTEAILQGVVYERCGCPGRLTYKLENSGSISTQDQEAIDFIGSDLIVDCWTYNFLQKTLGRGFDHLYTFISIIDAAVLETRGKPLGWLDRMI